MPGVSVPALPGQLPVRQHDCADVLAGGGALRGIDRIEVQNAPVGEEGTEPADVHQTSSRRKLMSMARAEWVTAPAETKSAPASAKARTFASVMPPDSSTRARPPISRTHSAA